LVTGLTPDPRKSYKVVLRINQLYNFFRPAPEKGDVLVVEGRVPNRANMQIKNPKRDFTLKGLYMYAEGAQKLEGEHFDPYPIETVVLTPAPVMNAAPASSTPSLTAK
jgi:hypothetical protein